VKQLLAKMSSLLTKKNASWMPALRLALFRHGTAGVRVTLLAASALVKEHALFKIKVMVPALGWRSKCSAILVIALHHASTPSGTLGPFAL
jgi:hypothetical protein